MEKTRGFYFVALLVSLVGLSPPLAAGEGIKPSPPEGQGASEKVLEAPLLPLQDLIEEAKRANPEIQAARRRVEAAWARVPQARALPDPMVSLGYMNESFTRLTLGSSEMARLDLSFSQEIPFPPKLSLKGGITAKEAEREEEVLRATELEVISRLKVAYYDLFFVEKSIGIVEKNKDLLEKFAKTAEARYAVGKAVQQDVLRAQTEITILLQRLAQLERERGSLRAAINSLLNRPREAPLGRPVEPPRRKLPFPLEQLVNLALERSPDVKATERSLERNGLALDLAKKQYYPDFTIGTGYTNRGRLEGMWQVMVGVTVPLYFKKKQDYGVREAIADLSSAQENLQAVRQSLFFGIKDLFLTAETSERLLTLIGTGTLPQAALTLESSIASYAVGKVDFLTLLTNLLNVLNQELQYYQELANFEKALARLERVVGVSFD
ncbi:MAG: TolC family protein [Candidatus Methylomirabilales bacterium]